MEKKKEAAMYRKFISAMYLLNIVFQSFFNLALPIGAAILASWLLVEKASAPGWIYAPLVIVGVVIGFVSMIRFILSATRALDRLEAEREKHSPKSEDTKNGK
jgi:TRAP-type C4-dicarboxylate transport system permease small subunit